MPIFSKPKVSVILASYNHREFIQEAVESVLCQNYSNFEMLVLDDGSTDGTTQIVEKIHDSRLRLIKLSPNRRFHARNEGLKVAQGKYIAFQNSDDVWIKNKLALQIQFLESNQNTVLCFTRLKMIDEKGKIIKKCWAHSNLAGENQNNDAWLRQLFTTGLNFGIASAVIRNKSIKKAGGFNESLIQMSDYDLWVRLLGLGQLYIIDKPLTYMRIIKGVNVSTPRKDTINRHILEYPYILDRYLEKPVNKYLANIFADVLPKDTAIPAIIHGAIAKYSWSLKTTYHLLFADKLAAQLLSHPTDRKQVLEYYGASFVKDFIKHRGELKVILDS